MLGSAWILLTFASGGVPARPTEPWKTGFWLWAGDRPAQSSYAPEILYVNVAGTRWPDALPAAGEYVIVFRIESYAALTPVLADSLVERFEALQRSAASGHYAAVGGAARITGLQIDYDCPTESLAAYAGFLRGVRARLPRDMSLSITALLDWFRPAAGVAGVLASVDEFVPQFYDTSTPDAADGIAVPIDAGKWAAVFNSYRVPYRIGISSFGRVARRRADASGRSSVRFIRDAAPADFARQAGTSASTRLTWSHELVVRYGITQELAGGEDLRQGDTVEITFPTTESVRTAVHAARTFGGHAAGVVAFRWPGRTETLALDPADIGRIFAGEAPAADPGLSVRHAACVSAACSDLYLRFSDAPVASRTLLVIANGTLDTFIPPASVRARWDGQNRIVANVDAYAGIGELYLGRAISAAAVSFTLVTP